MANRWTEEQQLAIDVEGNNVIVSAGAGSGKTAVLSERVLRKVKDNTHINELLILTFTKAAAQEMKDRIRSKLIKNNLMDEVSLIDGAYITTFDSYSLAVVKKYHHILKISSDIAISDAVLLEITKRDILDSIMEEYYKSNREDFKNLVCKFSLKDDKDLIDAIIKLSNKLDLKYDRVDYLNTYMDNFYSEEAILKSVNLYVDSIMETFNCFKDIAIDLESLLDEKALESFKLSISSLYNSKTYDEIYNSISLTKLARTTKAYSDDAKKAKDNLKMVFEDLQKKCIYTSTDEMKKEIFDTYSDTKVVVEILLRLDTQFKDKKRELSLYDFNDISHLAIKLVKENDFVCKEIKESFKEILIDEYQDTSDTQEMFISLISNNNVYCVGDIKQSIYRFRNANPYIFKNKYDTYNKDNTKGYKIDLNKNFRSREEVLVNINMLFDDVMDDKIGGADYKNGHRAIFGNMTYNNEGKTKQEYDLTVNTYTKEKDVKDVEKEAFLIARDIQNKVSNHYQIFDKDKQILRNAVYNDFVILMDKKKNFDLYKKIFEYLKVPLTVYREEKINNTDDFLVIHNLLKLVILVYKNDLNVEFKYSFMSIARSFLFKMDDKEIFTIFKNNSFKDTDIYKIAYSLKEEIEYLPVSTLFRKILNSYSYYDKILTTTDIVKKEKCIEYLDNLIDTIKNSSLDILDIIVYLDKVIEKEYDIKYDNSNATNDSVKIMSIHKSKGLEFPICYFSDLQNKFNTREQKEKVVFDSEYGILLPKMDDESKPTIRMMLYRNREAIEEISERIRLFYVALTRCKEHMILVCPLVEEDKSDISDMVSMAIRNKYSSFYSILKSIWYKLDKYVVPVLDSSIEYDNSYLYKMKISNIDYEESKSLKVNDLLLEDEIIDENHFSKTIIKKQTKEENYVLEFGSKIHKVFEELDFKNPNLDLFSIDDFMKKKIMKFLENDIIKNNLDAKFYKEYEFITKKDGEISHGIIDLLIEKENKILIVDYKLKDILDKNYIKQLNGYKDYIENITSKNVDIYLYSIMNEEFKLLS